MKTHTCVVVVLFCFVLALVFPTIVVGQSKEDINKGKKLERIDREIAEAQSDKTAGITKVGIGVGIYVLGWVAFTPSSEITYSNGQWNTEEKGNAGLFWACLGVGSVLEIWGVYQWWDAANTLAMLRTKRYDISFKPDLRLDKNGKVNPGLALQINF